MAEQRRGKPYIWVTWITGLLSGEDKCYWSAWFKSRFTYDKIEDDTFDQLAWRTAHDTMVTRRVAQLEADDWLVSVEKTNAFRVVGKTATLSAVPDIVAIKGMDVLVVDAKSGKRKDAHLWQLFIYMRFVKQSVGVTKGDGYTVRGELFYPDGTVEVFPEAFKPEYADRINQLLVSLGLDMPPAKAPSEKECGVCPIPRTECPERMVDRVTLTTTDF